MRNITRTALGLCAALVVAGTPLLTSAAAPGLSLPKIEGGKGTGFGGFITAVTPCICADLGLLISVTGPFGGDYLYSFRKPPKIKIGSFLMAGGPVLGGADGSGTCGTRLDHGCKDKKSGKPITYIGGILGN